MPKIYLQTEIYSPIEICFDLSTSIDLNKISTAHTKEQAVAGRTSGLINLNETVTWQAIHLGFRQRLTSKITAFERPYYFVDEQIEGIFKSIFHEHIFEQANGKVIMKDIFDFRSPFGVLGNIANLLFLTNYMKSLLNGRNQIIKAFAESEKWKDVIDCEQY